MQDCNMSASTLPDMVIVMHAGINFINHKLLQSQLFSYADAQRYLPVNRPQCRFHENNYKGQMQVRTHARFECSRCSGYGHSELGGLMRKC
jgi:catalase